MNQITREDISKRKGARAYPRTDNLPFAEQLVLWSFRYWVLGWRHQISVQGRLREAYARVHIPHAATWLATLMDTLSGSLSRSVQIHCACDRRISADEQLILDIFARCQVETGADGRVDTLHALRNFIAPEKLHLVEPLFRRFAETLLEGRLRLSGTSHLSYAGLRAGSEANVFPGSCTVH